MSASQVVNKLNNSAVKQLNEVGMDRQFFFNLNIPN